jgi:hypothetical protein
MAVSPTSGSPRGSLSPIPLQDAKASAVNATAINRLSPPPSPTKARLSSAEPARDPLFENYQKARRLIESNKEEARALFLTLIKELPRIDCNLLFLADCKLGVALTYPQDDHQRTQAILNAKKDIDLAYARRNLYFDIKTEKNISLFYKILSTSLQELKLLVPIEMEDLHADIALKIEECSHHISLLTDFYDKISQGFQSHLTVDQVREIYTQALQMITEHEEPDYLLARAVGIIHLALTFDPGDDNPFLLKAHSQTLAAYERKEELFTDDEAKLTALNLFRKLFNYLSHLFPDDSDMQEKLSECEREIDLLTSPNPEILEPSPTNSPRVTPRMTKEPVDYLKAARLIFAFGFATVVIVGAFVFGRRCITQLN